MTTPYRRRLAAVLTFAYLWSLLFAQVQSVRAADCSYDTSNPSIGSARTSFQIFDFECAEKELLDVLKKKDLGMEDRANAHMLLAAVYYEMFQGETHRRQKILEQFEEAFTAYRNWKGTLDIQSPEFRELMEEARASVESQQKQEEPEQPVISRNPTGTTAQKGSSKKWLLIGLGAVVVVGGVALAAGGGGGGNGDGGGNGTTALPDFPDPPNGP